MPIDTPAWFGIPFPDLDCPAWLPYLPPETIGQESPKLTLDYATGDIIDEGFATEWTLPPVTGDDTTPKAA